MRMSSRDRPIVSSARSAASGIKNLQAVGQGLISHMIEAECAGQMQEPAVELLPDPAFL